jgi:hypothetical protein
MRERERERGQEGTNLYIGFVSMKSNRTHVHVFAKKIVNEFHCCKWVGKVFASMKSNRTHFHVLANFLLMSFTLLQMGGKVFVSMS